MSFAGRAGGTLLATELAATVELGSYWSAQSLQSMPAEQARLMQIAQFMVTHPTVKVAFTGHTDLGQTEADRQALGLARAQAAEAVLTATGVAPGRITTLSRGGQGPVVDNSTAAGRAANRRVTIAMTQES